MTSKSQDPTRRCIVSRECLPKERMIRFVKGPEGDAVPDLAENLPGRGMWVKADIHVLEQAVRRNAFSRAAKETVRADKDLPGRVEAGLLARLRQSLGLAMRAGHLVLGYDSVREALRAGEVAVLIEAADGAGDGRGKIFALAHGMGVDAEEDEEDRWPVVLGALSSEELGLALGRANVIHAAVLPGPLADKLKMDLGRLSGFRALAPADWRLPGGQMDQSGAPASQGK